MYMDAVMKEVKVSMGRMGGRRLPDYLYADDLVLCDKTEEDLKVMVGCFVEVYRRGLKVNRDKSKVIVLGGDEGGRMRPEWNKSQSSNTWGYVLDESGTDDAVS